MIIIHRCSCGHPDVYHKHAQVVDKGGSCSYGACHARGHELGMPELLPTWVDGRLNEYVYRPGDASSGYSLCDCEDCMALYREVAVDVPPLRPWFAREPA